MGIIETIKMITLEEGIEKGMEKAMVKGLYPIHFSNSSQDSSGQPEHSEN